MRQIYVLRDYEDPMIIFATLLMKEGSTFDMDILHKEMERRWDIANGGEYGEDEFDAKHFTKEEIANDDENYAPLLETIVEKYIEHYEHCDVDFINFY